MLVVPKAIYGFNAMPIKFPMVHFTELEQINPKFLLNNIRPLITKAILRKKKKVSGIMLSDFRLYCEAVIIKTVWYLHKDKDTEKWN